MVLKVDVGDTVDNSEDGVALVAVVGGEGDGLVG